MNKLEGIATGDRVRVTFDGTVERMGSADIDIRIDGDNCVSTIFDRDDIAAVSFAIENIEPLAVGDAVINTACFGVSRVGKIEAIFDFKGEPYATVSEFSDGLGNGPVSNYARANP